MHLQCVQFNIDKSSIYALAGPSIHHRELGHRQRQPLGAVACKGDLGAGVVALAFDGQHLAFAKLGVKHGQAHAQTFEVECAVPALSLAEQGEGRSRRTAEQDAARRLLDLLKASDKPGSPLRS